MNKWIGSINSQIDMEVLEESALARAQATIQKAIDQTDMSRADVARAMGRPRSFVTRILSGDHNLTIRTMTRALAVCGLEVQFDPVPLVWSWESAALYTPDQRLFKEGRKPRLSRRCTLHAL